MKSGSVKRVRSDEEDIDEDVRAEKRRRIPLSGVCKHFDEQTNIGVIEWDGREVWFSIYDCVEDRAPVRGEVLSFDAIENSAGGCKYLTCCRVVTSADVRDGDCSPEMQGNEETTEHATTMAGNIHRGPMLVSGPCMHFDKEDRIGFVEWNGQDAWFSIYDCVEQREPSRGEVLIFKVVEHVNDGIQYLTCRCVMTPEQIRSRGNGAYSGICVTFDPHKIERGICLQEVHHGARMLRVKGGKCIYGFLRAEDCIGTYPCKGDLLKFDLEECTEVKNRIIVRAVTGGSGAKHFHGLRWDPDEGFRVRDVGEELPDGWN